MSKKPWKCCGCGKTSPARQRSCNCPTAVLYRGNEHALKIEPKPFPYPRGIGRMADNERALLVSFDICPTDDEMRMIHTFLKTGYANPEITSNPDGEMR